MIKADTVKRQFIPALTVTFRPKKNNAPVYIKERSKKILPKIKRKQGLSRVVP